MSLINDALKRAKQAQQENPPPTPPLAFRPVDPSGANPSRTTLVLLLSAALVVLIAGCGLALWYVVQQRNSTLQAEAKTVAVTVATVTSAPPRLEGLPPLKPRTPLPPGPGHLAGPSPEEDMTNSLPAQLVPAAAAPPNTAVPNAPAWKLQGIFFDPQRPSALISGRTVYVGNRLGEFRVLAITTESVTLGTATQTNVLSLSE